MRILQVYKSYYPDTTGGVETMISVLCRQLSSLGVECELFTTSPGNASYVNRHEGLRIHYFKQTICLASSPFSWQALRRFKHLSESFDLIHYHFPWPFADLMSLTQTNKPYLITYHSDIVKQKHWLKLYRPLMRRFLKRADYVVATSEKYAQNSPILANTKQQLEVVPLGVDDRANMPVDAAIKNRFAQRYGKNFFLSLGVLRYYKGLDQLIMAAKDQPYNIVIAGDGPEMEQLQALCQQQAIANVHLIGYVTEQEKWALMDLALAVVSTANQRSEAFCISLVEGLMMAKPLISTEIGTGTSWVNQHGETGWVVPSKDVAALQKAMQAIYQTPDKYRHKARQRYEALFKAEQMASNYLAIYQRCLA